MRLVLVSALACLALAGCSAPDESPPSDGREPDPTEATASVELSPSEMQEAWWTWSQSAPEGMDPVADTTGEHCSAGQPDGIWLLAGTYGGSASRSCEVPVGRPLVAPAVNLIAPKRETCSNFLADARGAVTMDGVNVDLERIEPVEITFDSADGLLRGFACGLWARIPAPDAGEHRVGIKGSSGTFTTTVGYTLSVS